MKKLIFLFLISINTITFSQEIKNDSLVAVSEPDIVQEIERLNVNNEGVMKFNPKKAGIYSAILPGLGQFYNKKYWKIPIVFGALGTSLGITFWNNKQYKRYKTAFNLELKGEHHEFSDIQGVDAQVLGRTMDRAKRQRDYAIAASIGIYILNVMDAIVDAHLYEGRNDPDLAVSPTMLMDPAGQYSKAGLSLSYRF